MCLYMCFCKSANRGQRAKNRFSKTLRSTLLNPGNISSKSTIDIDKFRKNMAAYFVKLLRTKLFGSTKGSKKTHSEEDLERTQRRHVVPFPEDMNFVLEGERGTTFTINIG